MLSNQSFDTEYLKQVIADLEKAEKMLDTDEQLSLGKPSSVGPQQKRDKFVKQVVDTPLFKNLQLEFFKIVPKLGQDILTVCFDAYTKKQLTDKQRDELAEIGNSLTRDLPFKLLTGKIDVKQGFTQFMGALRKMREFLSKNPSVASNVGPQILSLFKPLENFVKTTLGVVKKADVSPPIKEGFSERLDQINKQSVQIAGIVKSAPKPTLKPLAKAVVSSAGSALMQGLQKDLLAAIFPIGGQLLNVGFSLFNGGILNDKQRNELGNIGMEIMSLPYKLLTGEIDLNGVVSGLTKALESLFNFFVSNPDIAIKAGATILPSLIPLGGFLSKAFSLIGGSDLLGGLFKKGISLLSGQVTKVEDTLEKSALKVTQGVHGKIS